MQAMILAAGFGTRLLPYSGICPKPLFPLLNKPLLLLTVERMQRVGCDHIIVNCHHLKEQICEALRDREGVVLQEEEEVLGTGGGLRRALRHFRDEPVLVSNGDIYHTVDFRAFSLLHEKNIAPVTLALHDYPRFNSVKVRNGYVRAFTNRGDDSLLAFTGLHIVEPEILEGLPSGAPSCIIDFYRKILLEGVKIRAVRVDGSYWTDMGTPKDYLALHGGLITGAIPRWQELGEIPGTPLLGDETAQYGKNLRVEDWACVGKARVGDNVVLKRSVLWDNAQVDDGAKIIDSLVCPL